MGKAAEGAKKLQDGTERILPQKEKDVPALLGRSVLMSCRHRAALH